MGVNYTIITSMELDSGKAQCEEHNHQQRLLMLKHGVVACHSDIKHSFRSFNFTAFIHFMFLLSSENLFVFILEN